jgi:hypothetical protein
MDMNRVICDDKECKLTEMACDSENKVIPFRRYKRKKIAKRPQKVFKGAGRRKRVTHKKKVTGKGQKRNSRQKRR